VVAVDRSQAHRLSGVVYSPRNERVGVCIPKADPDRL